MTAPAPFDAAGVVQISWSETFHGDGEGERCIQLGPVTWPPRVQLVSVHTPMSARQVDEANVVGWAELLGVDGLTASYVTDCDLGEEGAYVSGQWRRCGEGPGWVLIELAFMDMQPGEMTDWTPTEETLDAL